MYKKYLILVIFISSLFASETPVGTQKTIKMCVDPYWLPFEAIVDGKHIGIVSDIIQLLAKRSNRDIILVETSSWNESLDFIKHKKCDILAAAAKTKEREPYLNFTKPYLIFPQVIVTREKEDFIDDFSMVIDKKIGITKGSAVGDLLRKKYPNINLVDTKNMTEGLYDVSSGKLFGFVNTSAAASYAVAKNGMSDLKVASKVGIDYHLSIAVEKDNNNLLFMFNQLIATLDKKDVDNIKKKWLKLNVDENIDYSIVYKIIFLFLIIVSIVIYWNRKLKDEIKQREIIHNELEEAHKELEKKNKRINKVLKLTDAQSEKLISINQELQIAKVKAQESENIKADFLAKMSHEIRTPMNAVLGMLYLVEKTNLSSSQADYIKKATGAANSLLGVINDILDFSKIEANKLDIKNEEFNINNLIADIMSVMSIKASQKDIELLTYYDQNMPQNIISDSIRISQILNNLLSNALKFTQNGDVLVSTKLVNLNNDIATLMFCTKDSGIGISKENQEKLFSDFYQVDNSSTRTFEGTGLGLAICKKLSKLLGGDIWIEESKEGIGTTICFTIKVKVSKKIEEDIIKIPYEIKKLNILIVDDNSLAVEVLKSMLESFNYNVTSVNNGYKAIEIVQENNYDLIFLDYKMPDMDGLETYNKIKNILKENTPKTIMVTAYSAEFLDKDIEKDGINGYLSKPISPSSLFDKIMEVVLFKKEILVEKKNKVSKNVIKDVKVLLVEDNILNQEFAKLMLEMNGATVDIACDGLESLNKIKSKKYDIVLMDIQMPHMDGLEATRHIRAFSDEYFKNIPIIALSANALVGDKEKSIKAGMNDHISKPIKPDILFQAMKNYLNISSDTLEEYTIDELDKELFKDINTDIIDTDEALSRIGGNQQAYMKILHQFSNKYENIIDELETLKEKKDIEKLHKTTHSLKGISGNISANKLFDSLSSYDNILKENKIPDKDNFEQLKINIIEVFNEISKVDFEQNIQSKGFIKTDVIDILANILKNLDEDIVLCEEYVEKLLPYLENEYKDFSNQLKEAIELFDTDRAVVLIEQFLKDINSET